MEKHTPGPWVYLTGDEWSHSVATQEGFLPNGDPCFWTVASINKNREPDHVANARLIAASPELLAALIDLVQQVESGFFAHVSTEHPASAVIAAKAIINKATGEQA